MCLCRREKDSMCVFVCVCITLINLLKHCVFLFGLREFSRHRDRLTIIHILAVRIFFQFTFSLPPFHFAVTRRRRQKSRRCYYVHCKKNDIILSSPAGWDFRPDRHCHPFTHLSAQLTSLYYLYRSSPRTPNALSSPVEFLKY